MRTIKIKDNSEKEKNYFDNIPKIVDNFTDKTLGKLESEGLFVFPSKEIVPDDLSSEQKVIQSYNNRLKTGNIMGIIGCQDERLIIESRFSKGSNDFFFQYMLENVLQIPNFINMKTTKDKKDKIYNWLFLIFPSYLKGAMRKGLFKMYVRKEYNDENISGSLDVTRHIRRNTPFLGKIAYSKREYSYDNYVMELIRHTIEAIKQKPYGMDLLNLVKDEVKLVVEATENYSVSSRSKIIEINKKKAIRHAYFHEYRKLQKLCLLILENRKFNYGDGANAVYGILFDGAWLWEEYINSLIKDDFYHPCNKKKYGKQTLFNSGIGEIYPDFIGKNPQKRIIADAKYKPQKNISGKDYLQLIAYMYRFDAKQGFYLYPEAGNMQNKNLNLLSGTTYEKNIGDRKDINIVKYGFKIPISDGYDYEEFVEQIKKSEVEFVKKIKYKNM